MSKLLENKKVLITGASSGIGKSMATHFAREGAHLILMSSPSTQDDLKSTEQECKSEGCGSCECFSCDLSGDLNELQNCCSQFKEVDILVNNAGMFCGKEEDPLKGDVNEWHKMMMTNIMAPMLLTKHFGQQMEQKGEGVIINIGDVEGHHTGPRHPAYAASKHALRGFSLSTYELLREKNIKVCLIEPGNVSKTKMLEETGKGEAGQGSIEPDDVAKAALFVFQLSKNAVPSEIELKAMKTGGMGSSS